MSQENVEIVRKIYCAWSAGSSPAHLIARDIEYVNPPYAIESGTRHDRKALGSVRDVYPDFRIEPEQYIDAGDEVLVIGMASGTGASGVRFESRQAYAWTIRDGRAVRFRWFNDPAEALEAVGQSEQPMSQENIESLRRALDAFTRGDRTGFLAQCDPEIEWVPPADWPETATIRGPEATWDFIVKLDEPWEQGAYELVEVIDGENDRIAARVARHVRGKTSGVGTEFEYWNVVTFRAGKLLRSDWITNRAEAIEAVGLSE